jgi:hypothetical protein
VTGGLSEKDGVAPRPSSSAASCYRRGGGEAHAEALASRYYPPTPGTAPRARPERTATAVLDQGLLETPLAPICERSEWCPGGKSTISERTECQRSGRGQGETSEPRTPLGGEKACNTLTARFELDF